MIRIKSRTAERAKRHDNDHDGDENDDHVDDDGDHRHDDDDSDHDQKGDCNQKSAGLPKEQRGIMTTATMSIHRHLLMST